MPKPPKPPKPHILMSPLSPTVSKPASKPRIPKTYYIYIYDQGYAPSYPRYMVYVSEGKSLFYVQGLFSSSSYAWATLLPGSFRSIKEALAEAATLNFLSDVMDT